MPIIVDVQLRKTKDTMDFASEGLDINAGDRCIVETENGLEAGIVISNERIEEGKKKFARIVRKLTPQDRARMKSNRARSKESFRLVLKKIEEKGLDMKLTSVDYTFDRTKLFVYYTAEGRVDFRELIKDLGMSLKTRIQMVQIGVRDETKILGGIGPCGRQLCCCLFLREFKPVSIDMAKEQDMALNPAKISGVCGRLLCCLNYENEIYKEYRKNMPKIDSKVNTKYGQGVVKGLNILKQEVLVGFDDGTAKNIPVSDISRGLLDRFRKMAGKPHPNPQDEEKNKS